MIMHGRVGQVTSYAADGHFVKRCHVWTCFFKVLNLVEPARRIAHCCKSLLSATSREAGALESIRICADS